MTVTSVNAADDYFFADVTYVHTYTANGNFKAGHYSGDRLSAPLINNHDQDYGITTTVNVGTGNSSPVSSLAPIVNVAAGIPNAGFLVPANDPNGNPLSFTLATPADLGLTSAQFTQPTGFSITAAGQVTFSTVGKTVGQYYNAVVKISDGNSFIVVDFLIRLVANTGTAPVFVYNGVTPANGSTIQGVVGTPISFSVKANDTDAGSTVTLNGAGLPPGSSFSSVTGNGTATSTFSYTPTVAGNSVLTFSAIDDIGKQTLTSVTIQICSPINPTLVASNNGELTCTTTSLTLTATGGSYYVLLGPNTNQSGSTNRATVSLPGTYTVIVSGGNSCPTSVTTAVTSNTAAPGNVTLNSSGSLTCAQTSVVLTAGSSTTGVSYVFNGPGITGQSSNTATVNKPGTYTVVSTGTNGCVASTTTSVSSNTALPTVSITPSTTAICAGQSTTLTAAGADTYTWSIGGQTTASISVSASGPYSVTGIASNGCSNTATASVTVNPLPTVSITPSSTVICAGQAVTLSATAGLSNYKWSTTQTTSAISVSVAGPYSVTVTDANGCSNTATASVTVNPLPTVSITPSSTAICAGQAVTLSATPRLSSYQWSTTSAQTTAAISVSVAGAYSVTVTDANGCSNTATASVTVNPLPTVSITPSSTAICAGQTVTLAATAGLSSYKWSTTQTTSAISVSVAGAYSVTVTDANGCSNTATASVTVNPLPTVSITPSSTAICTGQSVTLMATSGLSSYKWSTTQTTSAISVSVAGPYSVTVTDANGCSNTATASITVNPLPTVSITPSTTAICAGQAVTLSATAGLSSYQWNTTQTTSAISVSVAGPYSVTVTDANGCSNTATASVTVNPLPTVSITPSITAICAGQSVTLMATSGLSSYKWSTTQTTSAISVSVAGAYSVTVTDANGCSNTAAASVTVNPLPTPTIVGLVPAYCQDAAPVSLTGSPTGGTFTIDGTTASILSPTSLSLGQHTVAYSYTNNNGCSNVASQTVTVKETPQAPVIVTQSGHSYPAGVSNLTINRNVGDVILTVSGCANGSITWNGGNSTTLAVSTFDTGVQTFTALCTTNGCTSPLATATVTVLPTTFSVFHRDGNGQLNTNTLSPYLQLQNDGNTAIPYSEITVRYWLTVENYAPLLFSINYAQLGSDKVHLRYVPATTGNSTATGYIEFSFDASAGSLGAMSNSGPIQDLINKQDYSFFDQSNDYSYAPVGNFTPNERITAYRNGVIIYGHEPMPVVPTQSLKAQLQNNTAADANSIVAVLQVLNDGNQPVNYGDLKVRYYFTADGPQPLVLNQIGYTALGAANVTGQLVTINPPLANADTYLEVSFSPSLGSLAPGASTGTVTYEIRKSDYSGFNQNNDYSYQGTGGMMLNQHVVVYLAGQKVYGTEPGTGGRLSAEEVATPLRVQVLGNPLTGSALSVSVQGSEGQRLRYELTDGGGRLVSERQVERAAAVDEQTWRLEHQPSGLLLLRVSTPTQTKTVKVLKAD